MNPLRIAVWAVGTREWLGGVSYVEYLFRAVRSLPQERRPQMFLLIDDDHRLDLYGPALGMADGLFLLGPQYKQFAGRLPAPSKQFDGHEEVLREVDMIFPVVTKLPLQPGMASWIWDFQHVHMPDMFSPADRAARDELFGHFAAGPTLVLSSRTAEADFRSRYPSSRAHTHVLHFHFLPPVGTFDRDPIEVQQRYGLPERFLLCCNQFWMHKNHIRLFEAIRIVRERGCPLNAVFTGRAGDDRSSDWYPGLMELIKDWNIDQYIKILGIIPREDQLQLMRRAMFLVQPSRFEGWSTVVEDARALGKVIALSGIPVHREQNPKGALFFNPDNSRELADILEKLSRELGPGPDRSAEALALGESHERVLRYAESFLALAEGVRALRRQGR